MLKYHPKYHPLTWIGIVGGAFTLFANFKDGLNLADWARTSIGHWQYWNYATWVWALGSFGIEPSPKIAPALSFAAAIASLAAGLNFSLCPEQQTQPGNQAIKRQKLTTLLIGAAFYTALTAGFALAHDWLLPLEKYFPQYVRDFDYLAVFLFPTAFLIFVMKERRSVILASVLYFLCAICLLVIPALIQRYLGTHGINTIEYDEYDVVSDALQMMVFVYFCQIGWMAVVLFTPVRPLIQSLAFLLTGVAILAGLGELSGWGRA